MAINAVTCTLCTQSRFGLVAICIALLAAHLMPAHAAVSRIEITSRVVVAGGKSFGRTGPYERVRGRLYYAVKPDALSNNRIVDLQLAGKDAAGRVNFSGDFVLLKPLDPNRGNGRLLYGVNNRGNIILLHTFNDADWNNAPESAADFGNDFLLNSGYTLLWSAWNWDVVPGGDRMQIELPVVQDVTGPVAAEMTTSQTAVVLPVAWGGSRGYLPAALSSPNDRLTVRQNPSDNRRLIPRHLWQFVPRNDGVAAVPVRIELGGGFAPDLLYEVVYQAKNPRVTGLGLAAIRDALSFFRYESVDEFGNPNPVNVRKSDAAGPGFSGATIYGFSQSARVIQHMLLEGMHVDEDGRPAFDAGFIHGPGAGKGSFNHRFAQTTRHPSQYEDHLYPADFFPFATTATRDPVTGRQADLFEKARRSGIEPKLFYLTASTEYWTRAASLLHTDVSGSTDVPHDDAVRIYAIAGAQHSVAVRIGRGGFENCHNPLDYRPLARALLVALDGWITTGRHPPESKYPRLADRTLGTVAAYRREFPEIPGRALPKDNLRPPRLDHGPRFETKGIVDRQPSLPGPLYQTLVPLPDANGLDSGGIRLPEVAVPLGTYLGWNLRRQTGNNTRLGRWQGSFIPFPRTKKLRHAAGDGRVSILARYATKHAFLDETAATAKKLVRQRLLLERDVPSILSRASRAFSALTMGRRGRSCQYLDQWRAN